MERSRKGIRALLVSFVAAMVSNAAIACDEGHWVQEVSSDGSIVILEDGSVWKVDQLDVIYTILWLPTTSISVCDDMLINMDDGETVTARRLK